ncbi:MAG: hypothetical protein V3U75_01420 [Methylococcaceae bacterium]
MEKGDYVRRCITAYGLTAGNVYRVDDIGTWGDLEINKRLYNSESFEPVKVAVHCKTRGEWDDMSQHLKNMNHYECDVAYLSSHPCYNFDGTRGSKKGFEEEGYRIISAQEYLGEEEINQKGESKVVVKVGDKVLITGVQDGEDFCGEELVVRRVYDGGDVDVRLPDGGSWYFETCNFKTTTNNIKGEDKMNVNNTIAKVFKDVDEAILVTKWMGNEYEENNHRALCDLRRNKKEALAEAQRKQTEADKD